MPRMICCLLLAAGPAWALDPITEDVDREQLRHQGRQLVQALEALQAPLPPGVVEELQQSPDAARIQELLDPLCLVAVHINPESRVKAARGPASAELGKGPNYRLVKVHNEAGVTHALTVTGPQLRRGKSADPGRWLEVAVIGDKPLRRTLSGQTVEYVVVRLVPHETGKREATLRFDVGQGTQDLGFRAEVPVLFTIR